MFTYCEHCFTHLASSTLIGGSLKSPLYTAQAISALYPNFACVVISRSNAALRCNYPHWIETSIRVSGLARGVVFPYILALYSIRLLIKELWLHQSIIIQCHHPLLALLPALVKYLLPSRIFLSIKAHGTSLPEHKSVRKSYGLLKRIYYDIHHEIQFKLEKFVIKKADLCFVSSFYQMTEQIKLYTASSDRIRVIRNASFRFSDNHANVNKRNRESSCLTIGFVARSSFKKNLLYFLETANKLSELDVNIKYIVVYSSERPNLSIDINSIIEHRFLNLSPENISVYSNVSDSDLSSLLLKCDFGMVPSLNYESIPSIIYEFMAHDVVVYASYKWGIPEILHPHFALSLDLESDIRTIMRDIATARTNISILLDMQKSFYQAKDYESCANEYLSIYTGLLQ